MNIKIYLDRYTETCCVPGTQFEQNATVIKFDFSELDFIDDECIKTIHFFHDSLEEANYIGDSIIQNDEFKIPKSITKYEDVLAFIQITKEDFIWKTKSFNLDFYKSLDVDKTLDEDEIGILQELILEVQQIKTDTADEYKQLAEEETKKFNDNAAEKTAEYNENAAEKITEYDNHIEELDNIVSKNTVNGESIYIDDALEYKVFGAKVDGNAEQTTTTGKNLYKPTETDFLKNGVNVTIEENVITLNGEMITGVAEFNVGADVEIEANQYYKLSYHVLGGTGKMSHIHSELKVGDKKTWGWLSSRQVAKSSSEAGILDKMIIYCDEKTTFNNYQIVIQVEKVDSEDSPATDYEPYTGGETSPNPDYPQEIETITNSVKIVQTGKNLFDKNGDFTHGNNNNLTTLQEDGTIKTTANFSNQRSSGQLISVDKNTNYTVSGILVEAQSPNNTVIEILNENNTRIYMFEISNSANYKFSFMFNSADNEKIWISLNARDFNLSASVYAIFDKIQIEEGTVSTDYEEYQSNEHTINLQSNELVKLADDIKDEITIDKNGNVSLSKRIGKVVLNGTENWIFNESGTNYIRFTLFINDLINNQENNKKYVASDYFVSSSIDEAVTDSADANRICAVSNQRLLIKLVNDNVMNLDDFKAWLSENNVTCYYQLLNVSETINLGQLTNFKTYEGVNHFFLEANIATNFEIRYAQDLKKVISKQQAEIDELKTLLSSTTTSALLLDNYASDLVSEIESEVEQ